MSAAQSGLFISTSDLETLIAQYEEAGIPFTPGWMPNACRHCSRDFELKIGTGSEPRDPDCPCRRCGRWHPAIRGYGPQAFALITEADEIFMGGARGGGKSGCMTMWLAKGNPLEPRHDEDGKLILHNVSYLFHSAFRALVIRKNVDDLRNWIDTAASYFKMFGGDRARGESEFKFPSGAKIYFGHLKDATSFEKYQGMEIQRLAIEEITHIPTYERYARVRASVRSIHPELKPQVFLSGNPGSQGHAWCKNRFVQVKDDEGNIVKPFTLIKETFKDPWRPQEITRRRIFVPARLDDNPFLYNDGAYTAELLDNEPHIVQAWLHGDWDAISGSMFPSFRPNGPIAEEPKNADHVIVRLNEQLPPDDQERARREWNPDHRITAAGYPYLGSWWPRAIGADWGFAHRFAAYKGAQHPDTKQVHVYDEMSFKGVTMREAGHRIAEWAAEELDGLPNKSITCHLSHDAFRKSGVSNDLYHVEEFQRGIQEVLGRDSVFIPYVLLRRMREQAVDPDSEAFKASYENYIAELERVRHQGITLVPAGRENAARWDLMRRMMRWERPWSSKDQPVVDPNVWTKLIHEGSIDAAVKYRDSILSKQSREAYPQLQIWDTCPRLIAAMPLAQHQDPDRPGADPEQMAKEHFDGRDEIDAVSHLLAGMRELRAEPPPEVKHDLYMEELQSRNPHMTPRDKVMAEMMYEKRQADRQAQLLSRLVRRRPVARMPHGRLQ